MLWFFLFAQSLRPLHCVWLHCCLSRGRAHKQTALFIFVSIVMRTAAAVRWGEPNCRKLGVWRDKTQHLSDTVPWQPVRAEVDEKHKSSKSYITSALSNHAFKTNPVLTPNWYMRLSIQLPSAQTWWQVNISLQSATRKMCDCRSISKPALWVSTSPCPDKVLLK